MALPAGFPDATTTGWQNSPGATGTLTTYAGATTLDPTANGTTYTNVDFQGLTVGTSTSTVDSITFQGCRFRSSWNTGWNVQVYGTNIKFQYCTFEPLNSQAVPVTFADSYQYGVDIRAASSVTIDHCDIWGFGNAVQIEESSQSAPVVLQNSYIHDAADQDGSGGSGYHHDGFLSNNGGPQYVTITGNTIFSGGNTNAIALQSTGTPYDHITLTGNLLGGFGYTVNIGDGFASGDTNVVFTDNTFTTNSPLPAYGPLKITWPTGGNNIWARNKWHYGGNGDPTADGKYWLPNGGQVTDWNNLTGFVSSTDYLAAGSGVDEYRTWTQTDGPATDAADNAAYSMGTEFYTSVDGYVTKIHYFRGTTAVTPVTTGAIYDIATSSLVANSTVTFADPGTTTGWITGTLATPLPITANKHYKAVVLYPNNYTSTANYWSTGAGATGIVNGILTVPSASTATGGGQQTYATGAALTYPNQSFNGGCYWVDVSVTDALPGSDPGSTNYLLNPGFESDSNSDGIADNWLTEKTTATAATYTHATSGVVEGAYAQRMQYTGEATNDGRQKVEFYQATEIGSFQAGDSACYEVWLSGSVTGGGYAQIVIEGHTGNVYLDEVNQVVELGPNPQPYRITHPSLPAGTDSVVIVVMAVELTPTSAVDITADAAFVGKGTLPPVSHVYNYSTAPSFEIAGSPPGGWTEANSSPVSVAYTYPTTGVTYGAAKLNWALSAVSSGTNNQAQLIGATTDNGTFAEGDSATLSLEIDGTMTGCSLILQLQFMAAGGGSAGAFNSAAIPVTATTTRVSHTAVAPANTTSVRPLLRITGLGSADAFNLNIDGVLLQKSATVGTYFDGSMSGYEWQGAANNSVSRDVLTWSGWPTAQAPATAPGSPGDPLQASMNRVAGTTGLDAQGAANVWAGTTGLALVGALNVKAGTSGLGLAAVLNELAGTQGLEVDGAASRIQA